MSEWKLNNKFNFEGREVRYGFEGSGPTLVLVHGTPWSSFNLRHLISGLSDSFTVYYFDRGYPFRASRSYFFVFHQQEPDKALTQCRPLVPSVDRKVTLVILMFCG